MLGLDWLLAESARGSDTVPGSEDITACSTSNPNAAAGLALDSHCYMVTKRGNCMFLEADVRRDGKPVEESDGGATTIMASFAFGIRLAAAFRF